MQFCSKCGHRVQDNAHHCPKCGTSVKSAPIREAKRLHCPSCGGYDLTPHVESTRGGFGTTQAHASRSWICQTCGNMFRHPDDVIKEAKRLTLGLMYSIVVILGSMAVFAFILSALTGDSFIPSLIGIVAFSALLIFLIKKLEQHQIKKAEELRKACFE